MEVFAMAPPGTRALWLIAVVMLVILIPVGAMLTMVVAGLRGARFEVSAEGLRLHGDLYGRLIPASELVPERAARVDLTAAPGLRPKRRTLGTGLPGYQAGWFDLQNGEKALLYLTDRTRAVYVPTTSGYAVLLSPADPDGFLAALQAARR